MKLQGNESHDKNGDAVLCPWPPRNAPVFRTFSLFMERCNDLLELVQTVQDFRLVSLCIYMHTIYYILIY